MGQACFEARRAGDAIAQLTDVGSALPSQSDERVTVFSDRTGMVKAARLLLSSVTKVLVLADRIVIKQIITSRNKVLVTLDHLERVSTFQEFVQIFSQFGNEMVEFAHLTGDRQNTCLRHPDCESARINKDAVFHRMRCALEQVIEIVTEARSCGENKILPASIYNGIKDFKSSVESLRENLYSMPPESMGSQMEALVERTEDFTDSAYTSHEQRQAILSLCQLVRQDTQQLMHVWIEAQSVHAKEATEDMEVAILKTCQSLHKVAVGRASDLLKVHGEQLPLRALKAAGAEGNLEAVAEYSRTLTEQKEQLVEVGGDSGKGSRPVGCCAMCQGQSLWRLPVYMLRRPSMSLVHRSSRLLRRWPSTHPVRSPRRTWSVLRAWESQLCDMALLLREISDVFEGRREQTSMAKLGLDSVCCHQTGHRGGEVLAEEGSSWLISTHLSTQLVDEEKSVVMTEMEKLCRYANSCNQGQDSCTGKDCHLPEGGLVYFSNQSILTVYKSERSSLGSPHDWRERQDASTPVKDEGALNSKNSNGFGVKSLEQHMAGLNLLESK
ncbi:hypothetical protein INR49_023568 [Caranx melampygus]|nr:hypothetical protein INR49_023568 [Caranx melampygus]